jgi:L-lactate utilization protein LutC
MDRLLDRIRSALEGVDAVPAPSPPPPSGADIGDDLVAAFGRALELASGRLVVVPDEEAAAAFVAESWSGRRVVHAEEDPDENALREADVGVDRADGLIAETGTVAKSYASRAGARVGLVPPVSVFLAREEQLVRDLPAALSVIAETHRAGRATTVLVTGPSRTADIEKQLVIPAHGPREVVVVLILPGHGASGRGS